MKDPEKRKFYDQYGSEEEFREKYYQQYHHQPEEEDIDPMDLFFVILTGGDPRRIRRQRQRPREHFQQHEQHAQNAPRMNKYMALIQLLPFIVLVLFSVIPYIFQSVIIVLIIRDRTTNFIGMKNFTRK